MRLAILLAGLATLSASASSAAQAQEPTPPASEPSLNAAPAPAADVVPAGSAVIIELVDGVSSRVVRQGDMFPIRLAAPITHNGRIVVPTGAPGQGQVVDAGRAGMLGKPAKLVLAARYINVDGVRIAVRGFRLGAAGRDNSNAIMAASFVPYVGLLAVFATGGEIDVPAGTLGQAKLSADLPVGGPPPGPEGGSLEAPNPEAPPAPATSPTQPAATQPALLR